MLSYLEKFQFFLSGLILFLVVALLLVLGVPESRAYLPPPRQTRETTVSIAPPSPSKSAGAKPAPTISPRDRETLTRVNQLAQAHRLPRRSFSSLVKKEYAVPRENFEVIRNPSNWIKELDKAGSRFLRDAGGRPTMLELDDIEQDSYFQEFGFQNGDRICLVNGESMEFDPSQSQSYVEMAQQALDDLERGGQFTVTVLRNGEPVNLEFALQK